MCCALRVYIVCAYGCVMYSGVLGICENDASGSPLLVMEYMHHGSLFSYLRQRSKEHTVWERLQAGETQLNVAAATQGAPMPRPFPTSERIGICTQCALAVNHLHQLAPPYG